MNAIVKKAPDKSNAHVDKSSLTSSRLLNSLEVVASLIKNENDSLWPVLEKLEYELLKHKKRQSKLSRYLNKN